MSSSVIHICLKRKHRRLMTNVILKRFPFYVTIPFPLLFFMYQSVCDCSGELFHVAMIGADSLSAHVSLRIGAAQRFTLGFLAVPHNSPANELQRSKEFSEEMVCGKGSHGVFTSRDKKLIFAVRQKDLDRTMKVVSKAKSWRKRAANVDCVDAERDYVRPEIRASFVVAWY